MAGSIEAYCNSYNPDIINSFSKELGYAFYFHEETTTTMDEAHQLGLTRAIVLADHQTRGKGRRERSWLDQTGKSILVTFVEIFDHQQYDPPQFSLLPPQMFALSACLALQQYLKKEFNKDYPIAIRWPDDLIFQGKKLGGILLADEYRQNQPYPKLFGLGINVNYENTDASFPGTDYGAISLMELVGRPLDRQELLLAIIEKWSAMRVDLKTLKNRARFEHFDDLWRENSELLGKRIRISGIFENGIFSKTLEGKVIDSSLGKGIMLQSLDGRKPEEIISYNTDTKIEIGVT